MQDSDIKINALEDIIKELTGASGAFIHELCLKNSDMVTIGGVQNVDTHIYGTYENEILWIEKSRLLNLLDTIKLVMSL